MPKMDEPKSVNAVDSKPATKSVEAKTVVEAKPVTETKPIEVAKPATEVVNAKPAEAAKPAKEPKKSGVPKDAAPVSKDAPPSAKLQPRGVRGTEENDAVKPDRIIPSKEKISGVGRLIPFTGSRKGQPNGMGLVITENDKCANLTTWKGGVCVVQGNKPCPYLGGAQETCGLFKVKTRS